MREQDMSHDRRLIEPLLLQLGCSTGTLEAAEASTVYADVLSELERALADNPPLYAVDGGFIASGYSSELDEARRMRDDHTQVLAALQRELRSSLSISTLRIKSSQLAGHFIEVPAAKRELVPAGWILWQTTSQNILRYRAAQLTGPCCVPAVGEEGGGGGVEGPTGGSDSKSSHSALSRSART